MKCKSEIKNLHIQRFLLFHDLHSLQGLQNILEEFKMENLTYISQISRDYVIVHIMSWLISLLFIVEDD